MTQKEQLWENYEDAVFAILMDAVAEQEGEKGLQLMEELEHDPSAQVPEGVQRKAEKTIRKAFAAKNLYNLIIREYEDHTEFNYAEQFSEEYSSADFTIEPGWLPDGFTLSDEGQVDALIYKTYQNKNKADVSITKKIMSGGPLLVDSENAIKTKITIQKHEATLIEKEAWRCLVIPMPKDDKIVYFESNGVSSADVIKIAENLPL